MKRRKTFPAPLQDPLALFHSRNEIEETKNYFKYLFFTDIPTLVTEHNITGNNFAESVKAYLNSALPNYLKAYTPCIFTRLYGSSSVYVGRQSFHIYEHCMIRSLHTVQYLRYLLSPNTSTMTESQFKYHKLMLPDTPSSYIPGHFERIYLSQYPLKFQKLQTSSTDTSSYAFWSKQFSKGRTDRTDYFLFILGRLAYKNEEQIPVLFPEYNLKYYNHIQNYQNRIWQGINSAAFKTASPKLPNDRLENIITSIRNICALPSPFNYASWNIKDIPENQIWLDNILVQYQCERYFNIHLIKHIVDHKPEELNFQEKDLWLSFFSLPNVFTRKQFVNMAFEEFKNNAMYNSDIYNSLTMDRTNVGMMFSDISDRFPVRNKSDSYAIWLDVVFNVNRYLSNVVFPFYEKLLFLLAYYVCNEEDQLTFDHYETTLEHMETFLYKMCCDARDTIDADFQVENTHNRQTAYDVTDTPEHKHMYLEALNALFNNEDIDLMNYFHIQYDYKYFKVPSKHNEKGTSIPTIPDMYHSLIGKHIHRLLMLDLP